MKVLLFAGVLFLFAVLYAEAWPLDDDIIEECHKELGISEGNTDESKLRCLGLCVLKKKGILESDGKVHMGMLKENIPATIKKEQVDEFLKKTLDCIDEFKIIEDQCNFVNAVIKCSNVHLM